MDLPRRPHPVDRRVFPVLMVVSFGLGVLMARGWNGDGGLFQPVAAVLAVVFFVCFLILFSIYWTGWLMREHEVWREERRHGDGHHDTRS